MLSRRYTPLILLMVLCLSACGQLSVGIEGKTPTAASISPEPVTVSTETPPAIVIPTPNQTFEIPQGTPTESLNPTPNTAQYWKIQQDPYALFRFAAPCFWRIGGLPDGEPKAESLANFGMVSYGLYNFPEEYASAFPRGQGISENGGFKVAFELHKIKSPAMNPKEFVQGETDTEQAEIMLLEETTVNGLPAVDAQIRNKETDSIWHFYMIQLNETTMLRFFTEASGKVLNTPDVQSLLHSITVDPNASISLPTHIPAAPPTGVTAACMP